MRIHYDGGSTVARPHIAFFTAAGGAGGGGECHYVPHGHRRCHVPDGVRTVPPQR